MIDPESFVNHETGAMQTTFVAVPPGEYVAMIPEGGVNKPRKIMIDGEVRYVIDINWEVSQADPAYEKVKAATGMTNPSVRQGLFLDLKTDAEGNITGFEEGPGKNVQLGRLREALNQNDVKKKWSFKHLEGATARITVEHNLRGDDIFAQVTRKKGVTKL